MFPLAVRNPFDHYELAILHRPLFPGTLPEDTMLMDADRDIDLHRESIWISYSSAGPQDAPYQLRQFTSHHRLAAPVSDWESLKIGSGAPPVMTKHGWLFIYHGVTDLAPPDSDVHHLSYSAGVMILSKDHPQELLYRSTHPALAPSAYVGPRGTPSNVVFPTGIDRRDDIGEPDRIDVYYGINDYQIAVARLDIPDTLPHAGQADPPESPTDKTVI
jgi:predicted GH43/DUF377 family glycosyl hydrolase